MERKTTLCTFYVINKLYIKQQIWMCVTNGKP